MMWPLGIVASITFLNQFYFGEFKQRRLAVIHQGC